MSVSPFLSTHSSIFCGLTFAFSTPQKLLLWVTNNLVSAQISVASNSSVCSLNDDGALDSLLVLHQAPGKPWLLPWLQLPSIYQTLPILSAQLSQFCSAIHLHLDDSCVRNFKFPNTNYILFSPSPKFCLFISVPYPCLNHLLLYFTHLVYHQIMLIPPPKYCSNPLFALYCQGPTLV